MQQVVAEAMAGRRDRLRHQRVADPQRRRRPAGAVAGRPTSTSCAALLEPVRDAGRGVVALLPGGVIRNDEVFDLQREVGRPFTWTALLTIKGIPYHERVIEEHDAAWADGVEVWPQVSCRPLVFQMNLPSRSRSTCAPSFPELMDRPLEERIAAYRDPAWRARGVGGAVRAARGCCR